MKNMANETPKPKNIEEIIFRRNTRLLEFLDVISVLLRKEVRLIGDENKPSIIVNDEYCLSAFVHNFDLNFTDVPRNGNIIYSIKLEKIPVYDTQKLLNAINNAEHWKIKKIQYIGTDLFLAGYNSYDKEDITTIYPVFSRHKPKVYFSIEGAQTAIDKYCSKYPLKIV